MTHEEPSTPVTREKLYEEVWTTPVHLLAPRYGLSDRGLAKLCARESIPVPPRGYWAKVHAGHTVPRPPLPPAPERPEALTDSVVEPAPTPEPETPLFSQDLDALRASLRADEPIAVRETLRGQHAAIRAITEAHDKWRASTSSSFHRSPWRSVRDAPGVSPALEPCALRLLDALARRAQDHGIELRDGRHRGVAVTGTLLGVDFTIYVYEPVKRVTLKPKPKDSYYDHEYQHSGRFELGITIDGYGPDRAWQGRPERLAERLDEVLPALIVEVDDRLRTRAEWARHRQEEEARARQRAEEEAARQAELRRRQTLLDESAMWRAVGLAREYVAAVEAACATPVGTSVTATEDSAWVAWARSALDRMDPVLTRVRARAASHNEAAR